MESYLLSLNRQDRYRIQRRSIRIGHHLAVDFANTVYAPGQAAGELRDWKDLTDFLELAGAADRTEADRFRDMGQSDARRCARAFARALELRAVTRRVLGALEAGRPLAQRWVASVNRLLRGRAGSEQLVADGPGWRLASVARRAEPIHALVPIARALARLVHEGRGAPVRKCANPGCILYFYDTSRTGRRRWCSMAVCGNRLKVAAHAMRRRGSTRG